MSNNSCANGWAGSLNISIYVVSVTSFLHSSLFLFLLWCLCLWWSRVPALHVRIGRTLFTSNRAKETQSGSMNGQQPAYINVYPKMNTGSVLLLNQTMEATDMRADWKEQTRNQCLTVRRVQRHHCTSQVLHYISSCIFWTFHFGI